MRAPAAGSPLSAQFDKVFINPDLKPGTVLTYRAEYWSLSMAAAETVEASFKILPGRKSECSVEGIISKGIPGIDLFTLSALWGSTTAPSWLAAAKSLGPETIKIKAGTFPGAARITRHTDDGYELSEWYTPGVGLLKRIGVNSIGGIQRRMIELTAVKR